MCPDNRPQPANPVRYDDIFFSEDWFRNWDILKYVLCGLLEADTRWKTILDYGCGPGVMIDWMNSRGVDYVGCDVSPEARELYLRRFGKNPERYCSSMEELSKQAFDLLVCFDVFEHMQDEEIVQLLNQVPRIPNLLVNISRVRGIPGHVNLKLDRAWISFFQSHGWIYEAERTETLRSYYLHLRPAGSDLWHKNMFLFKRSAKSEQAGSVSMANC
jgi:SAM-dependent methyltransferase